MGMIRGILFDKDGTLFDFAATWGGWAQTLIDDLAQGDAGLAGRLAASIRFDATTQTFAPDSPVIAGTPGDIAECLLPHLPRFSPSALVNHMNLAAADAPQAETVPLKPLLKRLRGRGLKLGVATNDAELPARSHLMAAGILDLLDFVAGSDSGYGAKPLPGPCFAFAEATRIPPAEIAMVGDSRHDLLSGRAAGTVTVAVRSGYADLAELEPLADVVLDNVGMIPGWMDRANAREPIPA